MMFKVARKPYSIAFWFAAILLGACGWQVATPTPTNEPPPELTDRSLLTGLPCEAPCWQGLLLGQSSKAEALAVAQALPFIDPASFPERSDTYVDGPALFPSRQPAIFVQLPCRMPAGKNCAGLRFVNDTLMGVFLFPNYYLSLGAVVERLGDPDYVQIVPTPYRNQLCDVALIWKQEGIVVGFLNGSASLAVRCDQVRGGRSLDPDLPVEQIGYSLPESLPIDSVPQTDRDFVWPGFAVP